MPKMYRTCSAFKSSTTARPPVRSLMAVPPCREPYAMARRVSCALFAARSLRLWHHPRHLGFNAEAPLDAPSLSIVVVARRVCRARLAPPHVLVRRIGARRRSRGPAHLGRAHHARRALARPGRDRGRHHAISGALCAARRAREAHAGGRHDAELGRVMDGFAGRPHVRFSPAPESALPQRRPAHRGGRQVLVRALQGRQRRSPEGARARGAGGRRKTRALHSEGSRGPTS